MLVGRKEVITRALLSSHCFQMGHLYFGTRDSRTCVSALHSPYIHIAPNSFNFEIIPSTSSTLPPPFLAGGSSTLTVFNLCLNSSP